MTSTPFEGLTPDVFWKHFEAMTRIPRCSRNEEQAARYVLDWAAQQGFKSTRDELGNIVVSVPGSAGKEGAPTVVLQGHLDMVGEKDSDSPHDFATDPIPVLREGDWLTADGTTLGADNGVGLAASLAVAEEGGVHGPLELLFTIDEETGLTGAQGLQGGFVSGKTMLNLDSEEEGAVYVGCAGGRDSDLTLPVEREAAAGEALQIRVHGLQGGHSGLDINTGRGNAIKILAGYLGQLFERVEPRLVTFAGGDKHNAIPREATATVLLADGGRAEAEALADRLRADLKTVFGNTDPDADLTLEQGREDQPPLTPACSRGLVDLVLGLPHGVLAMSQDVAGLVETSTNLAVTRLEQDRAVLQESSRSSVMPTLDQVQAGIFAVARLAGATPASEGGYPGWQPNMDSAVLRLALAVHEQLFGQPPEVKAIHAGLECGIIGEKMGGMDMLSFGPDIEGPHSPSERVRIPSVQNFYKYLQALLAALAG